MRDSLRDLIEEDQIRTPSSVEESSEEAVLSDFSDSEELIDDEIYLKRHLQLEIDEIRRYNIGVLQDYQGAASLAVEERISQLIKSSQANMEFKKPKESQVRRGKANVVNQKPEYAVTGYDKGMNGKNQQNAESVVQKEVSNRGYNLRRNPSGKQ